MNSDRMRWEELMAGTILGTVFGAKYEMIDGVEVPSSVVDLALRDDLGMVHAIEVTRHEVESLLEWSEILGGESWFVEGLTSAWHLSLEPGCRIKGLRDKALPLLVELEQLDLHQWWSHPYLRSPDDQPFINAGIRSAMILSHLEPGTVLIGEGAQASSVSIESLAEVVAEEKILENSDKLGRARADIRDLFVWVGRSKLPIWLGLNEPGVPSIQPTLPLEIDYIWLTSSAVPHRVLRCGREGWDEFESGLGVDSVAHEPTELGLWQVLYPGMPRPIRRS